MPKPIDAPTSDLVHQQSEILVDREKTGRISPVSSAWVPIGTAKCAFASEPRRPATSTTLSLPPTNRAFVLDLASPGQLEDERKLVLASRSRQIAHVPAS